MSKALPSIARCLSLFDEYEMLDNIRAHSILVAQVATSLIDALAAAGKCPGPLPNRQEAMAGALLHDIAKTMCIKTGCHHAEVGQQICLELGYPEISEIVAEHVVLKNFPVDLYQGGVFTAKEMVFYADKRVLHDQVVPLSSRLDYILKRYGQGNPLKEKFIHLNFQRTVDLEKYLFGFLDFTPDEVGANLIAIQGILPAPTAK
ncbi:MAG: HDIG domain-containing protein [Desulforhopalus sp.]|nr:HDIG domain-containing protein [Desulforhopalus sp.]